MLVVCELVVVVYAPVVFGELVVCTTAVVLGCEVVCCGVVVGADVVVGGAGNLLFHVDKSKG